MDGMNALSTSIKGSPKTVTAAATGGTGPYNGARGSTITSTTVKGGTAAAVTYSRARLADVPMRSGASRQRH
jgi:hypothetical protein